MIEYIRAHGAGSNLDKKFVQRNPGHGVPINP